MDDYRKIKVGPSLYLWFLKSGRVNVVQRGITVYRGPSEAEALSFANALKASAHQPIKGQR